MVDRMTPLVVKRIKERQMKKAKKIDDEFDYGVKEGMEAMSKLTDDECIAVMTELGLLYVREDSEKYKFPAIRAAFAKVYELKSG